MITFIIYSRLFVACVRGTRENLIFSERAERCSKCLYFYRILDVPNVCRFNDHSCLNSIVFFLLASVDKGKLHC